MATTPRGYPIFTGSMPPAGPVQMQQLAEAVDADVNTLIAKNAPIVNTAVVAAATSKRIDFPAGTNFTARPTVIASFGGNYSTTAATVSVVDADTGGFIVEIRNWTGAVVAAGNFRINYVAGGPRSGL